MIYKIIAGGACNFIKKETLAQLFSCDFCEISKNTIFYRTPLVAAFEPYDIKSLSQHFEKEIYRYVNISITKFLRAPILKNIYEPLLLKMCS